MRGRRGNCVYIYLLKIETREPTLDYSRSLRDGLLQMGEELDSCEEEEESQEAATLAGLTLGGPMGSGTHLFYAGSNWAPTHLARVAVHPHPPTPHLD